MVLCDNVDEMQALFAQTSGWIDSNNCSGWMLNDYVNLSMFSDRKGQIYAVFTKHWHQDASRDVY